MVHGRPGEGFAVCLWCPELPGVSLQCWEDVFIGFQVSGCFRNVLYMVCGFRGFKEFFRVIRSSLRSAGVGWSLDY